MTGEGLKQIIRCDFSAAVDEHEFMFYQKYEFGKKWIRFHAALNLTDGPLR